MSLGYTTREEAPEAVRAGLVEVTQDSGVVFVQPAVKAMLDSNTELLAKVKSEAAGKHEAKQGLDALSAQVAELKEAESERQRVIDEANAETERVKLLALESEGKHKELLEFHTSKWNDSQGALESSDRAGEGWQADSRATLRRA